MVPSMTSSSKPSLLFEWTSLTKIKQALLAVRPVRTLNVILRSTDGPHARQSTTICARLHDPALP
jgi:hypothetical protein